MLKRRWLLAAIFLGLLLLATWWVTRAPASLTVRLPDGRQFTLKAVTFGTEHRMVLGQPWARPFASLLPANWAARVGIRLLQYSTDTPSVMIWGQWQTNPKHGAVNYAALAGEEGTELNAIHYQSSAFFPKYRSVMGWNFTSFPRRDPQMTVRLYPGNNALTRRLIEIKVPNPAARPYPIWKAEPFPIRRQDGPVEVVLKSLSVGAPPPPRWRPVSPSVLPWNVATFEVREAQRPSSAWTIRQLVVRDATGNSVSGPVQTRSGKPGEIICRFSHVLWPGEPAHQLTLEFSRQTDFETNDLRDVTGVPVPTATQPSRVSAILTNHGVSLTSIELHSHSTSPAPVSAMRQNAYALVTVLPPTGGVRVSLVSAQDDRKRTLRFGEEGHYRNSQLYVPLEIPEGARWIDFLFAIHRTHSFQFLVQPDRQRTTR